MLIGPPPVSSEIPARDRILWTACSLFYRDGVRATGIDRVIVEALVTKVTFYRHFPSKNDLVLTFLADRHTRWMVWFDAALQRHGDSPQALVPALAEWLNDEGFRGCAFLNSSAELGSSVPGVDQATRAHKAAVTERLRALLPEESDQVRDADLLCTVMDGAIARALFEGEPEGALRALERAVALLER